MSNKPWGIFIPVRIQKIIYSEKKIEEDYILDTLLRRISVPTSYYVLNKLKISANAITFFSIFIAFLVLFLFVNSNYLYGSLLSCLWCLLDNMDGELARLQNSSSNFGAFLEKLNSNFFYMILFPSLSIGLFRDGLINFNIVVLTFFSLGFFIILRPFETPFTIFALPKVPPENLTSITSPASSFVSIESGLDESKDTIK